MLTDSFPPSKTTQNMVVQQPRPAEDGAGNRKINVQTLRTLCHTPSACHLFHKCMYMLSLRHMGQAIPLGYTHPWSRTCAHLLCNSVDPSPINEELNTVSVFPHLHPVGCCQHQWSISSLGVISENSISVHKTQRVYLHVARLGGMDYLELHHRNFALPVIYTCITRNTYPHHASRVPNSYV